MTSQYRYMSNSSATENVTENQTSTSEPDYYYYGYYYDDETGHTVDMVTAAIGFCLCVVIVALNAVVIVTLLKRRKDRNRLHFHILHLAVADTLVGLVSVLGEAITLAMDRHWYAGDAGCRLYNFASPLMLCASNNLLIGMSVDRFLVIKYPLKVKKIGHKLGQSLVLGAWLISVCLSIFFLVYSTVYSDEEQTACILDCPSDWKAPYLTVVAVVMYILPTAVIVVCYTGVCVVIWRKWREGLELSETNRLQNQENQGHSILSKAKVKSVKMTLIICLAFLVCWTPYFIATLIAAYRGMDFNLYTVLGMLYPLNSAANPLIFLLFNRNLFCPRDRPTSSTGTAGTVLSTHTGH